MLPTDHSVNWKEFPVSATSKKNNVFVSDWFVLAAKVPQCNVGLLSFRSFFLFFFKYLPIFLLIGGGFCRILCE